ncbi:unnamed protein product [Withania somnifera]
MDGGRALQLKHEINVESTIIERGTTKRDRDQPLEEFQPLLPLGRVSLLSELAGRGDLLINMNLESGWLIAASLSWRLSGRGGACYRNPFSRYFREEKRGIRQRRKANRAKLFLFGRAVNRSLLAYVVVGLPTRMRPPECLLGSGRSQADTYDRRRKDPHFIAPGERKFDRGLERRGGRKGSGWI